MNSTRSNAIKKGFHVGIIADNVKKGQTHVARVLATAIAREVEGGHVPVRNMSDPIVEIIKLIRQDWEIRDIERLKDDTESDLRRLMSHISQTMRADKPDELANRAFGNADEPFGIMTGIKFMPEMLLLRERIATFGGCLLVVDVTQDIWEQRMTAAGLTIRKSTDAVEMERPSSLDIVSYCKGAGIPVHHYMNDIHLDTKDTNPGFQRLCEMVRETARSQQEQLLTVR